MAFISAEIAVRRLRLRLPNAARTIYRFARSMTFQQQPSRPLSPSLVSDCRFVASREHLLDVLPKGGRVAEIGTHRGHFALSILSRNQPSELRLIDVDMSLLENDVKRNGRAICHCGLSDHVMATFPNGYFDWIYIDADHSYKATLRDAIVSAEKLKPGGFLVFNDFAHIDSSLGRYGVHRAVVDFATNNNWPFAFFAFQTSALYDVALQKPKSEVV